MATNILNSNANKKLLRKFGITHNIEIRLAKLNVVKSSLLNNKRKDNHFKCINCVFTTQYPGSLKNHIRRHTGEKPYNCNRCKFSTSDNSSLGAHLRLHAGKKPFACTLCKYTCFTKHSLEVHVRTHTGEKLYKCDFCKKGVTSSFSKNSHMEICKKNQKQKDATWVAKQNKYKCTLCNYRTAEAQRLKLHVMNHTGERPFPCSLCTKRFKRQGDLQLHIFTHTGEKPYNCDFCENRFSQKGNKHRHEKRCKFNPGLLDPEWLEKQQKFKCHLCKYSSIESGHLRVHLRTHTGKKPYACKLCNFKAATSSVLNCHLMTHTKEKPLKCPHCVFTAAANQHLNRHVHKIHGITDGKLIRPTKFSCQFCLKKFYASTQLKYHHLTHTGEKPYVCPYCKNGFTQLGNKNIHERSCKLNPAKKANNNIILKK